MAIVNGRAPWWVIIVGMSLISMLTAMVIFSKSEDPIVSVAIAGIITLCGIVYGLQVRANGKTAS